eukprot:580132-Prorocentrum_lima.AAC.1
MTSSLVGSEMCIRDSFFKMIESGRPEHPLNFGEMAFDQNGEVWGDRGRRPVSYTHLTLPTICSV